MATANQTQRPTNPPCVRQTTDQYDDPYFHSWRRYVHMALNVRNKLGFIDGTISKPPPNSRDSGSWSRCNYMVATWLMNYVSKKIGQSLLFISTAEGIWKNLVSI